MSRSTSTPDTPLFETLEPRLLLDGWDGYERTIHSYNNPVNLSTSSSGSTRILENNDDGAVTIGIGDRYFNFFERAYTGDCITISVNGVVSLNGTSLPYTNQSLTNTGYTNILAPMWDDWVASRAGAVYYRIRNNELVVQWWRVEQYASYIGGGFTGQTVTFSLALELHNNTEDQSMIEFNYADTSTTDIGNDAASASIGIRGANLNETDQYSYNTRREVIEDHIIRYTPLPSPFIDIVAETWQARTAVPEASPNRVLLPGEKIGTYWLTLKNMGNVPTGTRTFVIDTYARSMDGSGTTVKIGTHTVNRSLAAEGSNPYRVALSPTVTAGLRQGWHALYHYVRSFTDEAVADRANNRVLTATQFFVGGQQSTFGNYSVNRNTTLVQTPKCQIQGTYLVPARIVSAKKGRTYRLNIDTPSTAAYRRDHGLGYLALEFQAIPAGAILKVNVRLGTNFIARDKVIRADRLLVIGEIPGSLRWRKRITIDVKVYNAGARNSMHIDMAAAMQSRDQISPANAKNLLNRHPGRTWVRKILGL